MNIHISDLPYMYVTFCVAHTTRRTIDEDRTDNFAFRPGQIIFESKKHKGFKLNGNEK